jgi:hypothetical protein
MAENTRYCITCGAEDCLDHCQACGAYIDVDFSHYSEYDGRPIYSADCKCPKLKEPEIPSKLKSWEAPDKWAGTLGDLLRSEGQKDV